MYMSICNDRLTHKLDPEYGRMSGHLEIDSLLLIGVGCRKWFMSFMRYRQLKLLEVLHTEHMGWASILTDNNTISLHVTMQAWQTWHCSFDECHIELQIIQSKAVMPSLLWFTEQ